MSTMSDGNPMEKPKLLLPRLPPPPPSGLPIPPNSKTADGRERLQHIVNVAIEVATRHNHPDQVRAIREMYELSKKDTTISELMDKVLARKATPEQYAQFQKLMKNLQAERKVPSVVQQTPAGPAPQYQQNISVPTVGGSSFGANGVTGGVSLPGSEPHRVQVTERTTSLMESERQHIAETQTGPNTIQGHSRVVTNTGPDGKRRERLTLFKQDQVDIEDIPSNSRNNLGRAFGHLSDAFSDDRASKRLKRARREGELDVIQRETGNREEPGRGHRIHGGERANEGAKQGQGARGTPMNKTLFNDVIRSDKDFISKVVKGCLERSSKEGHADIGRAIQCFYERSLVESRLEGFFERLITGRIDKEPVHDFQRFIGEYIRNTQKSKLKGIKPIARNTVPTLGVKEVEPTGNQDRIKRGQTLEPEIITIPESPNDELTKISEVSSNVQKIHSLPSGGKPGMDSTSTSDANTLLSTMISSSPPVPES